MVYVKALIKHVVSEVYYISLMYIIFRTTYKANCSQGTNNIAELLALRTLLKLALHEGVCDLHVYGYSSLVVNWMLGTHALNNISLQNIGSLVKEIVVEGIHLPLGTIDFHIFKGGNQERRYILDFM